MLISLAIRDIILIERLELEFERGLCALTGETGAGKSILLDALGLALGGRAERALVRPGAAQGSVSAAFAIPSGDPDLAARLDAHGLALEDTLVLRRVIGADGRSRAFVNDQPVSTALLRELAAVLVEVHGQHGQQALLDPGVQRSLLDEYGRLPETLGAVRHAYADWRKTDAERAAIEAEVARAATEEAYWRHAYDELDQLAPTVGEETALAEARARLMNREKLLQAIGDALQLLRGQGGAEERLGSAQRTIERVGGLAGGMLEAVVAGLDRTRLELEEAASALARAGHELQLDAGRVEQIEERLFALRAAARKHQVTVDDLPRLRAEMAERLARIDAGAERLTAATDAANAARRAFAAQAAELSKGRAAAAGRLADAVMAELAPLKLDKARFAVRLTQLAEADWSGEGAERVGYEIATNPGQEPGPLAKIASGGELARVMLALKVVLAGADSTPCLVFDEVDTGIGGATADAVGERLARLGAGAQVLVVTHAPQVAARADHHWRVEKAVHAGRAVVSVTRLSDGERREEIARMLAGARITEAARAAAESLIRESA
jgi:DNA repair protein RecN (Recombination protein N)